MWQFIHHWIWEDIWVPVWPNWVAGVVAGIVLWFWKGRKWLLKHEEHQKKIAEIHQHLLGDQK